MYQDAPVRAKRYQKVPRRTKTYQYVTRRTSTYQDISVSQARSQGAMTGGAEPQI